MEVFDYNKYYCTFIRLIQNSDVRLTLSYSMSNMSWNGFCFLSWTLRSVILFSCGLTQATLRLFRADRFLSVNLLIKLSLHDATADEWTRTETNNRFNFLLESFSPVMYSRMWQLSLICSVYLLYCTLMSCNNYWNLLQPIV